MTELQILNPRYRADRKFKLRFRWRGGMQRPALRAR